LSLKIFWFFVDDAIFNLFWRFFMKLTYVRGIFISAIVWGAISLRLISKGISFFAEVQSAQLESMNMINLAIALSLFVGLMKGRWILRKSADRIIASIVSKEEPLAWRSLFPRSFLMVMMLMMSLGIAVGHLPIPLILRASIDLTVGTALMIGFMHLVKKGVMMAIALKNI